MVTLVRVDDRLLHGQVICAWVPHMRADVLLIASDEAAGDALAAEIIASCGYKGLNVKVKGVEEAASYAGGPEACAARVMLIVGDLRDAIRLYEQGLRFERLNIGNVHHENGRTITPYAVLDRADEGIIERLKGLGVEIEFRDVPASEPAPYVSGGAI
jgi:PTS system mannose-specific IIB component